MCFLGIMGEGQRLLRLCGQTDGRTDATIGLIKDQFYALWPPRSPRPPPKSFCLRLLFHCGCASRCQGGWRFNCKKLPPKTWSNGQQNWHTFIASGASSLQVLLSKRFFSGIELPPRPVGGRPDKKRKASWRSSLVLFSLSEKIGIEATLFTSGTSFPSAACM